ncbi:MAG: Ig-like domain-containing protein [Thermoplasmata archaeon]
MSVGFMNISVEGQEAYAQVVKGVAYDSYDENATLINKETGLWNGNVSVIELNDVDTPDQKADDAWNDGETAEYWEEEGFAYFNWDAYTEEPNEKDPYYWYDNPEEPEENILFLAEYQHTDKESGKTVNYTWISNVPAQEHTPPEEKENVVKYEPIPKPVLNEKADEPVGPTWINISIPYFKYTDFNENTGKPDEKGNFHCLQSYAVFVRDIKGEQFPEWTYIGNSKHDPRWDEDAKPPLPATDTGTNPNEYNTGRAYFNTQKYVELEPETEYSFMVRVNFQSPRGDDMGPVWGYGGGLGDKPKADTDGRANSGGSGTTYGSSGGGSVFPTEPDDQPPTVSITSPTNGDDIDSTSVTIQWSGSDDNGIDHYEIRRDSGAWLDVGTSTSHTYSGLSEGDHTVDVMAYDTIGQTDMDSVTFEVDITDPSITITSPSEGEHIASSTVTVYWSGSDSGSGIDYYYSRLDSGSWTYQGTATSETYSSLAESDHTVDIRAYDNAGNYNTDTVTFTVDLTGPSVSISSPTEGDYLSSTSVTVEWSGSDTNGIDYYETRVDSGSWINKGTSTSHTYNSLSEGSHSSDVRAYDFAGNYNTDTVNFHIDITDPVVTIDTPTEGEYIGSTSVNVTWTGSDSGGSGIYGYYVRLDGGSWVFKGSTTYHDYTGLSEGSHTIDVFVYDNAFNSDMDTVHITVDITNPTVSISSPTDGDHIASTSVTVEWSGSDANGIDYYETRIDGGTWIYKGTSVSHIYSSLSEAEHYVEVRGYDYAGNYHTDSVTFTVDITNPSVSITTPNDGDYISDTLVTVEWTGSDTNGIDYYETRIDGGGWINTGISTSHDFSGLSEDGHTVDVRAYDPAGNYNTDTVNFTTDISDPTVTITSPSNLDVIEEYDVTVYWTGHDDTGGSGVLTYYIRIDGGSWVNKELSTNHTYYGLSEGDHNVDVLIYDMAYNSDLDSVTFTIAHSNNISLTSTGSSNGWNFLSTKLIPLDTSLTAILDDPENGILNNYSKVMYYDASTGDWKTYVPGRAAQYNDLTTWNRNMGIWIQMINDDSLTIRGTEPSTTNIDLYPGWNMVGYPSTIMGNNGLPVEVTKIGVFNASCEYNIEYNYTPSTYNFEPGKAYWIYNSGSTTVTWTVNYA